MIDVILKLIQLLAVPVAQRVQIYTSAERDNGLAPLRGKQD